MQSVDEIVEAIERLPEAEFRRLVQRLYDRDQASWDEQIDRDSASGKLDFLFREAGEERQQGTLREWPPEADQ
jgi:hypothetical protein